MQVKEMKFTIIWVFLATIIVALKAETFNRVICDGQVFTPQCNAGERLAFDHANYGRTDRDTCGQSNVDNCHFPETVAILNVMCFGKSSCSVNVGSDSFQDSCPGESKYLNVTYSCVPESAITEACTRYMIKLIEKPYGYIKSLGYPELYQEKTDCVVKLTPRPGFKYDLTLIDLDVQNRDGTAGCYDWLIIKNEENAAQHFNHCGKYPYSHTDEPLKMEQMDNVAVIFRSDAFADRNRGFIIKYEEVVEKPNHMEL